MHANTRNNLLIAFSIPYGTNMDRFNYNPLLGKYWICGRLRFVTARVGMLFFNEFSWLEYRIHIQTERKSSSAIVAQTCFITRITAVRLLRFCE